MYFSGAWGGWRVDHGQVVPSTVRWTMMAKSKAIPFLDAPPKLDGTMVGDVGFDPFGFSNGVPLAWLREAEIKHGRICMLAVLGFIVQELYTFPFYAGAPSLPVPAHGSFKAASTPRVRWPTLSTVW